MAKELLPIVLSTAIWASSLARHKVLYQCDNSSVVAAICKGSARDTTVMQLLRSLWFFTDHYDIDLACTHIAGVANTTADHLSRNSTALFFHRIHTLHCCLLHYQPRCYRSPASQDRIGHRHTSVSCSFLPSQQSLTASTHKLYNTGIHRYLTFCQSITHIPMPTSELTLLLFVAHLAQSHLSYSTIRVYLSAIRHLHLTTGLLDTFSARSTLA